MCTRHAYFLSDSHTMQSSGVGVGVERKWDEEVEVERAVEWRLLKRSGVEWSGVEWNEEEWWWSR